MGGRIFGEKVEYVEVGEVELLERMSGAESDGRTERSGAERSDRDGGGETRLTLMC